MDSVIRKLLYKEAVISAIINSIFSFGITYFVFSGSEVIVKPELISDALPQSFFVTFFGVFIPTILIRKKIASGSVAILPFKKPLLPRNAFLRAVLFGLAMIVVGYLLHVVVLNVAGIEQIAVITAYVYKTLYGAALSLVVTPLALLMALKETDNSL